MAKTSLIWTGVATVALGASAPGELHEERHLERLAVEEDAVLVLAVLPEPLAVVGEEDDEALLVEAERLQPVDQLAHDGVRRGDLAVVGLGVPAPEGLGRLVGAVRLVDVEEREEGRVLLRLDPALVARLRAPGRWTRFIGRPAFVGLDGVVPEVEAAGDAARPLEDDARDGGPGGVALPLQELGEGRRPRRAGSRRCRGHRASRERPREDRGVRRKGERHVAVRPLEEDRVVPEGRERGRLDPAVAVEGEPVGAERVDADEDDGRAREAEARRPAVSGRSQRGARSDGREGRRFGSSSSLSGGEISIPARAGKKRAPVEDRGPGQTGERRTRSGRRRRRGRYAGPGS